MMEVTLGALAVEAQPGCSGWYSNGKIGLDSYKTMNAIRG